MSVYFQNNGMFGHKDVKNFEWCQLCEKPLYGWVRTNEIQEWTQETDPLVPDRPKPNVEILPTVELDVVRVTREILCYDI